MRLRLGSPARALVVAPHADDETIGAGRLLRALVRRGTRVEVVVVTDGAASHPGSGRWPRPRLVAERRRETRRALRRLGIAAGRVRFLGLPDGRLDDTAALARRRLRRVVAALRPALVVAPAADDAHPDHRAAAAALGRPPGGARRLAYRVWPPHRLRGGRGADLAGGTAAAKRSLLRCYRTQTGAITDDPAGFAIARHELAVFAHPIERFREVRR